MRATTKALALLGLAALTAGGVLAAVEQPKAAGPPAAASEQPDAVPMAELKLDGRTVRGRVLFETEQMVHVEPAGGGAIGYRKDSVADIRRFTVSRTAYEEERGDYHHNRAWETGDPPGEFVRARRAYQAALAAAAEPADRLRLEARLSQVAKEREEYHQEALRRQELAKGRQEAELAELEKHLTREKLAALDRQEQELRALGAAQRDVEQQLRTVLTRTEFLEREIADLNDDVDGLNRRGTVFITQGVFVALERSHRRLALEVRRLARLIETE